MNRHQILNKAVKFFDIEKDVLLSHLRLTHVNRARFIIIYAMRHNFDKLQPSTPVIGRMFNRDHSTIINALKRVENDKKLMARYNAFRRYLLNESTTN